MLLIEHRVNTAAHLKNTPKERGVEIDIRDYAGDLRLTHDPFESGETLDSFLDSYDHALLVLNVKCDGLESRIMECVQAHGIDNYFFLDVANPTLVKLLTRGERRAAVRYSEYEPIESALRFGGMADWVWVDCFARLPLDAASYSALRQTFKICIVSPELQGHSRSEIRRYRELLRDMPVDAVCTDYCADWLGKV